MIFILNTKRTEEKILDFIDRHIWGDTDLELPDWGKHKEYTKGIHFTRNKKNIKGIYRKNSWNEKYGSSSKWGNFSVHLRFSGKLYKNRKGDTSIFIITFPQFRFWFLFFALAVLTFAFWYKQDMQETAALAGVFGMGFTANILDQLLMEFSFLKEMKALFKKDHPFSK